ncbi:hypothetical protein IFM12276_00360 [Nocardia sputorum]|uniref:DUF2786 domain-containing protein n=1 Tax=Nocardia sputorum TaxID=2984338 RepID=A0ABN6TVD5_9NOCA|nr:hypothetical protein IFM12276_00360 [Nocardia sputorum]
MEMDSGRYIARLQTDPHYRSVLPDVAPTARVLVAGYHAAFATPPKSGTSIGVFPASTPCSSRVRGHIRLRGVAAVTTSRKMLGRIGALLCKAEGTDNQYEAKAFLAMAQRPATQIRSIWRWRGPRHRAGWRRRCR